MEEKIVVKAYIDYVKMMIRTCELVKGNECCISIETFDPVRGDETMRLKCEPIAPLKVFKEIYIKTWSLDETYRELRKRGYATPW